jgi:Fe-S-cluster containining protein
VIESFARAKNDLYSRGSRFRCKEACPRCGCKGDLLVSTGLFEILAQGRILNRSMAELLSFAFRLSPFADAGLAKVRIRFTLRKPCAFLENGRTCSIYEARPAECALFPEYLGLLPEPERREYCERIGVGDYPCVTEAALSLRPEREEAIRRLQLIHRKEVVATEICLFGLAGFSVDLRHDVAAVSDTENAIIPYGKIEAALEGFLARTGLYNTIMERLAVLEKEARMESFFSALSIAEALMEASL